MLIAVFFEGFAGRESMPLQRFGVDKVPCSKEHTPNQEGTDAFETLVVFVEETLNVNQRQERVDIML